MSKNFERTLKKGDTGPPVRSQVRQKSDGKAPDWDLASVRFVMLQVDSDGGLTELVNAVAAVEAPAATSGTLLYDWAPGDTDVVGRFMAFFEVTDQAGVVESYPEEGYIWINIEIRG